MFFSCILQFSQNYEQKISVASPCADRAFWSRESADGVFLVCQRQVVSRWQPVPEVLLAGFLDKDTGMSRGTIRSSVLLLIVFFLAWGERVKCSVCQKQNE